MTKLDETAVEQKPHTAQLTPDMKYKLSISSVTDKSWAIYVTAPASASEVPGATSSTSFPGDTELWKIDGEFLRKLGNAVVGQTSITIRAQGNKIPPSTTSTKVEMPAQSLWTQLSAAPATNLFLGENAAGNQVGIDFALTKNTPWQGTVTWYVGMQGESPPPQDVVGDERITLTYTTVSSSNDVTWYMMTQSPLSWRAEPRTVTATDSAALGVAPAQGGDQLYLAFTDANNDVSCYTSSDGETWSGPTSTGASDAVGLALASLNGTLYLACQQQQNGSSSVQMYMQTQTASWTSTGPAIAASSAPALGVFAGSGSTGVLCMAYLDASDAAEPCMCVRTWNGSQWSDPGSPGVSAAGAPALVGYNGQLLLAQQGVTSQTIEIYETTAPVSWSTSPTAVIWVDASNFTVTSAPSAQEPASALVLSNPSFCVYLDRLYLAFTDASQNVWVCSSDDGESWSGFAQLPQQIAGCEALASPALAAFTPSSGIPTLALAYVTGSGVSVLTAT
ncbi:hypothetical protein WME77_32405 [Sorangium sp. So ce764]|uniref:hypothetical protein n=1 Tax=Sorangium sp. So ce764 TaxID=3133320 RepID=UPI003F62AE88